jgi:uncharacterized protein YjaG (DUF416 family)
MLRYDEPALIRDLTRVLSNARVGFAAACAERLFPAYADFCAAGGRGDGVALRGVLERLWRHLLGEEMGKEQLRSELSRCMALLPGDDDGPRVNERAGAGDAAAAVAYALRALETSDPQEAAWAARRAYEAADRFVIDRLDVRLDAAGEARVMAHPVVQAEISRQLRDLRELLEAQVASIELVVRLRDRAREESRSFFVSDS